MNTLFLSHAAIALGKRDNGVDDNCEPIPFAIYLTEKSDSSESNFK